MIFTCHSILNSLAFHILPNQNSLSLDSEHIMVNPRNSFKQYASACSVFFIGCLVACILQIFLFSPISPNTIEMPTPSISPASKTSNLEGLIKLGEGILNDPEDVAIDEEGILYTATRDGWIKRLHKNGSWENWRLVNSHALLGIATSKEGGILACDAEEGLLKISEDGVTVLASHVNGTRIRFADAVIEALDGTIYFSVASTKFGLHNWYLDVLEAKPHGQLVKYDPSFGETSIALNDLGFANGVALSKDQDFLVVCESWKYQCLKHWLKGDNKGKTEIFIKDLPGGPDNIIIAPDGGFWIALLQITSKGFDFVRTSKASKHLLATFPKLIKYVNGAYMKAMVVKVTADGRITKVYEDPSGKTMSFVTSALEFEDHLYLGSLNSNFIGKLPLLVIG